MNDTSSSKPNSSKPHQPKPQETKSWLGKITDAFSNEPESQADVLKFLDNIQSLNLIDDVARRVMEGAMNVSEMQVRDIMIPRPQMVVLQENQTPEELLPLIIESGHSRFPVIGDNTDELLGVLLAKDLLPLVLNQSLDKFKLRDLIRPLTVIPESKRLTTLLTEFRTNHNHMAAVIDEYGGIAGLVTIEDVLEEIVGEIEDEYDIDDEDKYFKELDDGKVIVNALTPIDEFNEYFSQNISDEEFDTIGGILMQHFGRLPRRNESTHLDGLDIRILNSDSRRIRFLQISR